MAEESILGSDTTLRLDAEIQAKNEAADNEAEEPRQETSQEATPVAETDDQAKQYYTPDEMRGLDPDQIDTSRIPPEMQPFYKAMMSPVTRKSQQLSEGLRQLEQYQSQMQAQRQMPPQQQQQFDIMAIHAQDPEAAYQWLDQEYVKNYESDPLRAQNILAVKTSLQQREWAAFKAMAQNQAKERQMLDLTNRAISEKIPEWNGQVASELREFVINDLGYKKEHIDFLFNPRFVHPEVAAQHVKTAYEIYKTRRSDAELQAKRKRQPTKVEAAGSGFKQSEGEKWSNDDYFAMRKAKAIT